MAKKKRRPAQRATPPPAPRPTGRIVLIGVLGAVALLAIVGVLAGGNGDKKKTTPTASKSSSPAHCISDTQMDHYSNKDSGGVVHTDAPSYRGPLSPPSNPQYTVNPPSGGDHLSVPVPAGVYEGNRIPPDGNLVHSLEHGYVVIWFKPDASETDRAALEKVRRKYARDTLLVEREHMDKPVAVTAWGHRMLCDGVNTEALSAFVEDNRNQAPEKIPH
jgi:Protein of unknown function (DUF3105)